MIVRRSALVDRSAEHLFDLIEAAEHYPQFLPWCTGATVVSRDDTLVSADLRMRLAGRSFEMRTRNPKRRPELHDDPPRTRSIPPFRRRVAAQPAGADACKVAFTLDYEFDSAWVTSAAGPVFDRIANTLVDAFVQRALVIPCAAAPPPG